jgi:hypothetical protein
MIIGAITSLADLSFKCKTSRRYRQLAILGCEHYGHLNVRDYIAAINRLNKIARHHNPNDCSAIVSGINWCRKLINTEAELVKMRPHFLKKLESVSPKKRKKKIVKLKKKT